VQGWRRWTVAACVATLLFFLIPMLPRHFGERDSATAVLAQSIEAMSNVRTIHITGRMRTLPGDNFELIGADYDFVPLELWRQSNPDRWRVEKPGRIVVMDGAAATVYISQTNQYMKAPPQAGFVEWLRPLLNPETILRNELDSARAKLSDATVAESGGTITLTVRRRAGGSFTNPWTRYKSIQESNHTCVYRFDAATRRLQSLQVVIHMGAQDVTVLELSDIRYNQPLSDTLFSLQAPQGATRIVTAEAMPAPASSLNGPKDAAQYFFHALTQEDWNAVLGVYPSNTVPEEIKRQYGHLSVLSLGAPFKSGLYRGYFVPYRVRLSDGSEKSNNLAVRNDNPQKRWMVDGGF
jgi:outer membrane lipoprotein-sorting protein